MSELSNKEYVQAWNKRAKEFNARTLINPVNQPERFNELSAEMQDILECWINDKIIKRKSFNMKSHSYILKHLFESDTDIYVNNGTFKGAMLKCGFEPRKRDKINWNFQIDTESPALKIEQTRF